MSTTNPLMQLVRGLRPGRLLYRLYYAPLGIVRRCRREGTANLLLSSVGRGQMERAATALTPVESGQDPVAEVYFLSGRNFWYQTSFCAWSLLRQSEMALRPVVLDDGSLNSAMQDALRRIFPNIRFESRAEIEARLDRVLPATRFPTLRKHRLVYPHLRKLTDVHAGLYGWRLVLDSDMLFFQKPAALLDWLRDPQRPIHMVDVAQSYGYSAGLLSELAGAKLADRLNVGVIGLQSDAVDWGRLEHWCCRLLEQHGSHYLLEQGLTAMLLAGHDCTVVPENEYIALPSRAEVQAPRAVMHHYVAESKAWYFRHGWRRALATRAIRVEEALV
jgi:hypothetical protein